ncbi:CGNR zinc finger domain-containing protein [Pengzhenrongella sp.]|jgi:predicted RNA-binding Zn ribbon-like protein|uniref:CGNR zinc finger domain-containing protein n=1 Tax=Pengzhenrongella sp. TaxID=2888820 RepID=UPI002F931B42
MTTQLVQAPLRAETIRRLVNTRDIENATDELLTTDQVGDWLRTQSLLDPGAPVRTVDLDRTRALREALRAAFVANHQRAPLPGGVVTAFNAVAERAGLLVSFTPGHAWLARPRAPGVDGALGALLGIVVDAMNDGTWQRLKVCQNEECQWAFYDTSQARTGKWCSMRECGNRAKQRAWRARHPAPT